LELSFVQCLRLRLFGSVPVGLRTRPGWGGSLMFYAFRCPEHGLVENYPYGYGERLECPKCLKDEKVE